MYTYILSYNWKFRTGSVTLSYLHFKFSLYGLRFSFKVTVTDSWPLYRVFKCFLSLRKDVPGVTSQTDERTWRPPLDSPRRTFRVKGPRPLYSRPRTKVKHFRFCRTGHHPPRPPFSHSRLLFPSAPVPPHPSLFPLVSGSQLRENGTLTREFWGRTGEDPPLVWSTSESSRTVPPDSPSPEVTFGQSRHLSVVLFPRSQSHNDHLLYVQWGSMDVG